MANYLTLEEAAQKLGVPADQLVDLRSQGKVRGFRDGASWKFPDNEIERLADEMADGGLLDGEGSDLGIGGDPIASGQGSDVNLVASRGDDADVQVVSGESDLEISEDLLEIDSAELQLNDPAIMHDSAQLDLAIEPNAGSTGPVTDQELKEISESHPDVVAPEVGGGEGSGSMLDLESELSLQAGSDLSFASGEPDEDSGEELIGADDDSAMDVLGSDIDPAGSQASSGGVSSLELMSDLDEPADLMGSRGSDVLSELDLLGSEKSGSGVISGDSGSLLGSGLGSGLGSSLGDVLADDELVIADDDDDLVISGAGSDISVAGDSGINLMSPSDSGLSLESEPLDLAGSSISALDLGQEMSEGGSSGGGSGSMVDFQADEEFQLSPSGISLEPDFESGSQVIEVEDSEAIGEPIEFGDAGVAGDGDVFGGEAEAVEVLGMDPEEEEGISVDDSAAVSAIGAGGGGYNAYEVPFTIMQCITLCMVLAVLGVGGILVTDLMQNMWSYSDTAAPVSSITDSLVGWLDKK
ncbi:helix-turn-helix domain-containing protein [Rhodopirellula sp.]|nr:helix-turn-helix domain-containing protein [Rhodopirellula sp.]MDB4477077.1 helix-turn-helix domain-containing protein [Rhodopirellula sp.]MDB4557778.1 helix-turn-helix domain-containing protein [bacterium]MDB4561674.1 helix-turn-helix domain-containing protein [bacterium]